MIVLPFDSEVVAPILSTQEARLLVDSIKGHMHSARAELLRLYEGQGWLSLGYENWRGCVVAEFGASQATLYRELEAAGIEREISQVEKSDGIPYQQLHALKPLPDAETRREVWREAIETVERAGLTAAHVQAVAERKLRLMAGRSEPRTPPIPANACYSLILADPPWRYEHCLDSADAIENHYPTMDLQAICDLPVKSLAADDCILFLWTTSPKLEEAMRVIEAWGFTYRTSLVWFKNGLGMGHYVRVNHELLLIGACGQPGTPLPENRPPSVIINDKGRHSEKPDVFRDTIERMYPGAKRIELFCRSPRAGWSVWGNEVECTTSASG
jgi:N6-adenosine-specific RNA methylase IME4